MNLAVFRTLQYEIIAWSLAGEL